MRARTHTGMDTHTHTHSRTHTHIHKHTRAHTHTQDTCTLAHAHAHARTKTCTHSHPLAFSRTLTCFHTLTHAHTYTHTYVRTHTVLRFFVQCFWTSFKSGGGSKFLKQHAAPDSRTCVTRQHPYTCIDSAHTRALARARTCVACTPIQPPLYTMYDIHVTLSAFSAHQQ